jgi:hypothetical protein
MQDHQIIKAIEQHAEDFGLGPSTIGQMAVKNRHAYERLKKGTAHRNTGRDVMAWIEQDRAAREAAKAQEVQQ